MSLLPTQLINKCILSENRMQTNHYQVPISFQQCCKITQNHEKDFASRKRIKYAIIKHL